MQASAPDLIDLRGERKQTLDLYGADLESPSFWAQLFAGSADD